VGKDGDADAGAAHQIEVLIWDNQRQLLFQAGGKVQGIFARLDACGGDEFVAAQARAEFTALAARSHAPRQRLEDMVAGGMTMQVIDFLESIEIDGEQSQL